MSFIERNATVGKTYAPGWFLAHEECVRETRQIPQSGATSANGGKYQKMGYFYPANNSSTVEGILYEDVDVTSGDMPGSVVTKGVVYLNRLPAAPESGVQAALEAKGFKFINESDVVRPEYPSSLITLTVASAAGTASGDTAITVSGYTKASDESYYYQVGDSAATINPGDIVDTTAWTLWDGDDEITAASDKKIAVIVASAFGEAKAYGSATVVSND
jgi:hypothetical protein